MTFTPKRILCPIDLSPVSSTVLAWANVFAQEYGAKLTVLHAEFFQPPPYFTQSQIQRFEDQRKEARRSLIQALSELAQNTLHKGVNWQIRLEEAHPFDGILAWSQAEPPDLIVMGSHGRSGISRLLLGSVSENMLHHALCPMLIVRHQQYGGGPPKVNRVLCPVNFTDHDRESVEVSSSIAQRFHARLFLVHALEEDNGKPQEAMDKLRGGIYEQARALCETFEVVRQGDPAEQIISWAKEHEVELTVIGAVRRPFLEFTTLGTTTERVARHASFPVLIVPGKVSH